jgi:hypothetical protein
VPEMLKIDGKGKIPMLEVPMLEVHFEIIITALKSAGNILALRKGTGKTPSYAGSAGKNSNTFKNGGNISAPEMTWRYQYFRHFEKNSYAESARKIPALSKMSEIIRKHSAW